MITGRPNKPPVDSLGYRDYGSRPCMICSAEFRKSTVNQKCCLAKECRKEMARRWHAPKAMEAK